MRVEYCDDAAACWRVACQAGGWWLVAGGDNILALVRASVNQSANSNNTNNNLDSFYLLSVHARTHKARTPHTSLPLPMGQSRCIPSCNIHSIAHKHTRSNLIPTQYCELGLNLSSFQFVSLFKSPFLSFACTCNAHTRSKVSIAPDKRGLS